MVTVADLHGCALCGGPASHHPVQGFGHMDDTKLGLTTTKGFVEPSPDLLARRQARRMIGGHEIAEFNSITGEPVTNLIRTTCSICESPTLTTPERAEISRCGACIAATTTGLPGADIAPNSCTCPLGPEDAHFSDCPWFVPAVNRG